MHRIDFGKKSANRFFAAAFTPEVSPLTARARAVAAWIVEQTKPGAEKGTYLYPELYGQPASAGVGYEMQKRTQQP
jgi:hypothetical protein